MGSYKYLTGGVSALQAVGTKANEALHAELLAAFWQVCDIHAPVLQLRLNCFVIFEGALRAPGFASAPAG